MTFNVSRPALDSFMIPSSETDSAYLTQAHLDQPKTYCCFLHLIYLFVLFISKSFAFGQISVTSFMIYKRAF